MWLLLHFTRMMQVLKRAANRPVGFVDSAVMLNAKLRPGVTLLHVVALTRSLGELRSPKARQPELYRWTDGSYLEDQDMWSFCGIFRPVHLVSEPVVGIRDLWVKPTLPAPYRDGSFRVQVDLTPASAVRSRQSVAVHLRRPGASQWELIDARDLAAGQHEVVLDIPVPDAATWTAETPHLYEVAAALVSGDTIHHVKSTRTGMRSVEIVDGEFPGAHFRVRLPLTPPPAEGGTRSG